MEGYQIEFDPTKIDPNLYNLAHRLPFQHVEVREVTEAERALLQPVLDFILKVQLDKTPLQGPQTTGSTGFDWGEWGLKIGK